MPVDPDNDDFSHLEIALRIGCAVRFKWYRAFDFLLATLRSGLPAAAGGRLHPSHAGFQTLVHLREG